MIDLPPDAALVADTPRLRLVPALPEDAHEMFLLLNDQRLHDHVGGTPLGEQDVLERLRRCSDRRSVDGHELLLDWIVRLVPLGEAIGEVTAVVDDDGRAELTWVIGRRWQHHGFAFEAVDVIVGLLEAHAAVCCIQAYIPSRHRSAQRVAECLGMTLTGAKRGRWELWEAIRTPAPEDTAHKESLSVV